MKVIATCALLLYGMVITVAQYLDERDYDTGPLARYRVPTTLAEQMCRSDACAVQQVEVELADQSDEHLARYLAPPPVPITVPAGMRIEHVPQMPYFVESKLVEPDSQSAKFILTPLAGEHGGAKFLYTDTAGYLRSGTEAASGRTVRLDGGGAVNMQRGGFSEVHFQPVHPTMRFHVRQAEWLSRNDEVSIQFDLGRTEFPPGGAKRYPDALLGARVLGIEPRDDGAIVTLLALDSAMVRKRVLVQKTSGRPAFSDHVLLWSQKGKGTNTVLVAASTVVREGKQAWIWVNLDNTAVPVQVHADVCGAQSCYVSENYQGGLYGMPISTAHWRAMGAGARARMFRLSALQPATDRDPRLLRFRKKLIDRPGPRLTPGMPVSGTPSASQS